MHEGCILFVSNLEPDRYEYTQGLNNSVWEPELIKYAWGLKNVVCCRGWFELLLIHWPIGEMAVIYKIWFESNFAE